MRKYRFATRIRALVFLSLLSGARDAGAVVIPPARWGHVLCGNQLYLHGGHTGVNPLTAPIGSDLYSLDITAAFNTFAVPWVQLTPGPYASYHSAALVGPENTLLAIYGGNTSFTPTTSSGGSNSLNLYNTVSGAWSTSPLQDPPRREAQTATSRLGDGTMFVFGGMVLSADLSTESATAELWTLGGYLTNSNSSSTNATATTTAPAAPVPTGLSDFTAGWQQLSGPQVGSITDRSYHTATLVRSNGLLVIIGGVSAGALVSMSDILVYDTTAGTWSVQTATGATPPLRRSHIAVATSTGQIYIHGGTDIGMTTYFADVAILDTTSWSWSQPAIEGTAPTGRYSHTATMVGTNIMVLFGLTAGGATNNVFVLDTTTNTWQSSYAPSNLSQTSTKPEDWPGYKPPPPLPSRSPLGDGSPPQVEGKHKPSIGSIIGGVAGIVALTAILFVVVRRRRHQQIAANRAKTASYYRSDFAHQPVYRGEEAYQPTGMAFETSPSSFGQRMDQIWDSLGVAAFWRGDRRAVNRSQSRRLEDQDDEDGARGLHMSPITDQDIFLDAVHRARSRVGRQSPAFAPLQQPIRPGSPSSPLSPRVASGAGSPLVGVEGEYEEVDTSAHGRSYSDGFENSMQEMDVQMVAVPRGRLYVVNPSDEALNIQERRRDQVQVPVDDAPLESG